MTLPPTSIERANTAPPLAGAFVRDPDAVSRSPLVAVAISMAVVGALVATVPPSETMRLIWLLPLVAVGIEREIRTGSPSWRLGAAVTGFHLAYLLVSLGGTATLSHLAGAAAGAIVLLPGLRRGWVREGGVLAGAAFGAIYGFSDWASVAGLAALCVLPLMAWPATWDRIGRRIPVITAYGFGAVLYALLPLLPTAPLFG